MAEKGTTLRPSHLSGPDSNHGDAQEDRNTERRGSLLDPTPEDVSRSRTPSGCGGTEDKAVGRRHVRIQPTKHSFACTPIDWIRHLRSSHQEESLGGLGIADLLERQAFRQTSA